MAEPFFFLGTLNKVDEFSALWPGEKKNGDKSKIASTVLVSYPHCLCIVIEGDNNMRNERKKISFLKKNKINKKAKTLF